MNAETDLTRAELIEGMAVAYSYNICYSEGKVKDR